MLLRGMVCRGVLLSGAVFCGAVLPYGAVLLGLCCGFFFAAGVPLSLKNDFSVFKN